jgi:radical SAM protein with 4Fe4S-binding SPASM domain
MERKEELSTNEGKLLIDQIAEIGKPIIIMSGGEPLLRNDVFELARYGAEKGLRMAIGTNGTLITEQTARKLKQAGIKRVAISLDSSTPEGHDEFRGVKGSWKRAIRGIETCKRNNIDVQINTTITQQNYSEVDDIMTLAKKLGVKDFHAFFLVPTGRGRKLEDISPVMYERMIKGILEKGTKYTLNVKPTCAPQFMRIAKQMGLKLKHKTRGCIAGLSYCRIYPTGEVTPCPYLPIKLGNIRKRLFKDIWLNSEILKTLRDFNKLKGKCGICEYRNICGGCRARAYGLTSNFLDICGGLHEPTELKGDYLAEEPWCIYQPKIE